MKIYVILTALFISGCQQSTSLKQKWVCNGNCVFDCETYSKNYNNSAPPFRLIIPHTMPDSINFILEAGCPVGVAADSTEANAKVHDTIYVYSVAQAKTFALAKETWGNIFASEPMPAGKDKRIFFKVWSPTLNHLLFAPPAQQNGTDITIAH